MKSPSLRGWINRSNLLVVTSERMKIFRGEKSKRILLTALIWASCSISRCDGAVVLDPLGRFLAGHGYGGAQLVHLQNFFRVPIVSNGKAGDLIIDTGAPFSVVFRGSLGKLGLTETETQQSVHGAFGRGRERFGLTTIHSLTMGNCTLLNMPVAVASDNEGRGIFRRYGSSDGLFGLREMLKYGSILDLGNRLLFVRPNGPSKDSAQAVKSILAAEGYTAVDLAIARSHLRVAGSVNGLACHFIVDTGAFFTLIDRDAAYKARIGGTRTELAAEGIGRSGGQVSIARFPSLRIGSYEIANASAAVVALDAEIVGRGTALETAGLLGAEYLGMNSAVFDFNSGTLYLKPKPTR